MDGWFGDYQFTCFPDCQLALPPESAKNLKFGGVKQFKVDYMGRMLGEDSFERKIKDLIPEGDSWGAYFSFDEGDAEQDEVDRMEHLIITAQQWLDSEENFET
ncbi:hypothetical protein QYP00_31765 [Pseudomonas aeruginosa]|nr:hypothetical protein [Pseudomonas aeruginosa]